MNKRDLRTGELQKHGFLSVEHQAFSKAGIHHDPATMLCAHGDNCGWRFAVSGFERIEFQPRIRK
jgi:hypothetical protein